MLLFGRAAFGAALPVAAIPDGRLSLHNIHTDEHLEVRFRDRDGQYDPAALDELNHLLRCHYTQEVRPIDVRVLEFVHAVSHKLGARRPVRVFSGYRSPKYNELLIRRGKRVAKHSLHLLGQAIDISLPGVALPTLRDTARHLGLGGVGYYPRDGFVHLDAGRVRSW